MTPAFLLYLGVSKLLIYLGQQFLQANIKKGFLRKLGECDLCLGVWICALLAIVFKITILEDVLPHIHVLSEIVAGCVSAFLLHLLSLGWSAKYSVVIV